MTKVSTISDVYDWLNRMPAFQVHGAVAARLGLDRIQSFCDLMGNPERQIPCIHVAGTNGKGSVCAMLALAYEYAGFRCGLYMSPHLEHVRERIRINREMIPEPDFLRFFQLYASDISSSDLSYYEITTAAAFWWFNEAKADIVVLETGLGGRLDATNIVKPEISVITSIAHDHQHFLGHTITEIAGEKGGIIKEKRPVVLGNMPDAAEKKLLQIAGEHHSGVIKARTLQPRYRTSGPVNNSRSGFEIVNQSQRKFMESDLKAPVHRWNVAAAWLTVSALQPRFVVSEAQFSKAIANVGRSGLLPGRFEKLVPGLEWFFDGAHNPEAVRALIKSIDRQDWNDEPVIVLCIMKDKAQKKMLEPFSVFKKNYYYALATERAADITQIAAYLSDVKELPAGEAEILRFFKELTKQVVIFTGSFYFYSVVKRWISQIIKAG
ncbi:MAG: folylpolyglutamate synthase/dihydrofolate synthase family protein [Balneolales bacterium]